jgi:hypothetical protein
VIFPVTAAPAAVTAFPGSLPNLPGKASGSRVHGLTPANKAASDPAFDKLPFDSRGNVCYSSEEKNISLRTSNTPWSRAL